MIGLELLRRRAAGGLHEVFERGLEFALAGATVINGRAALYDRPDGVPLAPYLYSALAWLSRHPSEWAALLFAAGVVYFFVLLNSMRSDRYLGRAVMGAVIFLIYVAISAAILTGTEPSQAAERYVWAACLAFLASVYLGAQAITEWRAARGDAA